MAEQTRTQRQAAGHKAAATRKRNATKRSAAATRGSARRTRASASATVQTSARATSRNARSTTRQAGRTAGLGLGVAGQRVEELSRRAQRALYIQVGAAANVRDAIVRTARTYTDLDKVTVEFDKLERRGARALGRTEHSLLRRRRNFERDVARTQRRFERQASGLRSDAGQLIGRVRQIVP
jgi:hypothetical protein